MELRSSCFSITFLDAVEQNGADWPCEQAPPHVAVTGGGGGAEGGAHLAAGRREQDQLGHAHCTGQESQEGDAQEAAVGVLEGQYVRAAFSFKHIHNKILIAQRMNTP